MGNPVSHSRSPALHNAAFAAANLDAVYVPLLVDDMEPFLAAFPSFSGLSVTIPHKARLRADAWHVQETTPVGSQLSAFPFLSIVSRIEAGRGSILQGNALEPLHGAVS